MKSALKNKRHHTRKRVCKRASHTPRSFALQLGTRIKQASLIRACFLGDQLLRRGRLKKSWLPSACWQTSSSAQHQKRRTPGKLSFATPTQGRASIRIKLSFTKFFADDGKIIAEARLEAGALKHYASRRLQSARSFKKLDKVNKRLSTKFETLQCPSSQCLSQISLPVFFLVFIFFSV